METVRFRTEVELKLKQWEISHDQQVMLIGSCFSDHIGRKIESLKFNTSVNPFGVVYNPASIAQLIRRVIHSEPFSLDSLIFNQGLWHSMELHGSFSGKDQAEVIKAANAEFDKASWFLKRADFLLITFGTAWVYKEKKTGKVVSNCHKLPENQFLRDKLSVEEIEQEWEELLVQLSDFNPGLRLLFTVSPIRHLKDGAHENQLSKSALLLAIDQLIQGKFSNKTDYFPAYELVMDELRDYRFYSDDMIHLSETAIKFIFEKFQTCLFNEQTRSINKKIEQVISGRQHRLLKTSSSEVQKFAQTMIRKIEELNIIAPNINLNDELDYFYRLSGIHE